MRQKLEEGDLADVLVAEQEEQRYARKKWKQAEKERKRAEREAKSAEVERKTLAELSSRTYTDEDRRMVNEAMRHILTAQPFAIPLQEADSFMRSLRADKSKNMAGNIRHHFETSFPEGIAVPQIGTVKATKASAKSIVAHSNSGVSFSKCVAIMAIGDLLKASVPFSVSRNWKGRGYDSIGLAATLKIGDQDFVVEFTIKRLASGEQELYNLKVVPKEIAEEMNHLVAAPKSDREQNIPSATPHIIPQSVGGGNGENEKKANTPNRWLPSSNLVRQYLAANGLLDGFGK